MKILSALTLLTLSLSTKALSIATESNLKILNQEIDKIDSESSIWIEKDKLKDEIKSLSSSYNTYNQACSDQVKGMTQLCRNRKKSLKSKDLELYKKNCSIKKQGSIEASRKCVLLVQGALNNLTGRSSDRQLSPLRSSTIVETLIEPFEVKLNKRQKSKTNDFEIKSNSTASLESKSKKVENEAKRLSVNTAYEIKNKNILHDIWREKLDLPETQKQAEAFMSQIRLLGRKQLKIYTEWCLNEVLPSSSDNEKKFELEGLNQFNNKCSTQFNRLYTLCLDEETETEKKCNEVNSIRGLDQQIYQINEVLNDV